MNVRVKLLNVLMFVGFLVFASLAAFYPERSYRGVFVAFMVASGVVLLRDWIAGASVTGRHSNHLLAEGVAQFSAGDYSAAATKFTQATEFTPDDADLWAWLGWSQAQLGDSAAALANLSRAIELNARKPNLYYQRGVVLHHQEQLPAAIADYTAAIQINHEHYEALAGRAAAHLHQNNVPAAIADWTELIRQRPRWPHVVYNRACSWALVGEHAKALPDFDRAIELEPNFVAAYNTRAYSRSMAGDFAGALADLRQAVELDPYDPLLRADLAWCLATTPDASLRDAGAAENLARAAAEQTEFEEPTALEALAAAHAELGQWPMAIERLEQAIELIDGDEQLTALRRLEHYGQRRTVYCQELKIGRQMQLSFQSQPLAGIVPAIPVHHLE